MLSVADGRQTRQSRPIRTLPAGGADVQWFPKLAIGRFDAIWLAATPSLSVAVMLRGVIVALRSRWFRCEVDVFRVEAVDSRVPIVDGGDTADRHNAGGDPRRPRRPMCPEDHAGGEWGSAADSISCQEYRH